MFKQLNLLVKKTRESRVCLGLSYLIGFAFLAELIKREPVDSSIIYPLGTLLFIFIIMVVIPLLFFNPLRIKDEADGW